MSATTLTIATRKSALALWQAEHVAGLLRKLHPDTAVKLLPLSTRGDEVLDRSLAQVGGKGLFLKELELAMLDGRANIAVHSLKDVPADLDEGFILAAVLSRADPADAFASPHFANISELSQGAIVGTSSLRRHAQLQALRPDLEIRALRGNVQTRLAKLDHGDYDAIILAVAGLQRLGLAERIRSRLLAPEWLPAPGQAALAIECRNDDNRSVAMVQALNDAAASSTTTAERSMNRSLGGSCSVPVGALCTLAEGVLELHGLVGNVETGEVLRARAQAAADDAHSLGQSVARQLLDQGAEAFLAPHKP